jgi:hypothetical protein
MLLARNFLAVRPLKQESFPIYRVVIRIGCWPSGKHAWIVSTSVALTRNEMAAATIHSDNPANDIDD